MLFLREPRCPSCAHPLPMRVLWGFARLEESYVLLGLGYLRNSGLLRVKVGITCPNCGSNFRVMQTRIRLVRLILWATLFVAAALIGEWSRHGGSTIDPKILLGIILVAVFGLSTLQRFLSPYLATVRPPLNDEVLSYPLQSAYRMSDADRRLQ